MIKKNEMVCNVTHTVDIISWIFDYIIYDIIQHNGLMESKAVGSRQTDRAKDMTNGSKRVCLTLIHYSLLLMIKLSTIIRWNIDH